MFFCPEGAYTATKIVKGGMQYAHFEKAHLYFAAAAHPSGGPGGAAAGGGHLRRGVRPGAVARQLPIYSVERQDKCVAISFDAAWGDVRVRYKLKNADA